MNNIVEKLDTGLNTILNDYVRKPTIIRGIVHLLLVLYAVRLAPTPPKAVLQLFDNVYFKLFIFSLVLWTAQFSPSTSILIALAFMVTVNYTTTGKLWEMMDNIGAVVTAQVSPITAIEAVKSLSDAAISSSASSPTVIAPIANIAASAATTQQGVNAIKALAEQAVTPAPGTHENVTTAVTIAVHSISPSVGNMSMTPMTPMTPMTSMTTIVSEKQAVQAVQALASAASSPVPIPASDIAPVAQIALSAATTQDGINAIKALADQAVTQGGGESTKVDANAQIAVSSIQVKPVVIASEAKVVSEPAPVQQSGCYPMRNYDMSKVSALQDGKMSFEDYQTFTSTPQ